MNMLQFVKQVFYEREPRQVRLHWTPLPWDIGVVHVTGISGDKFPAGNVYGYVKKKKESAHDI